MTDFGGLNREVSTYRDRLVARHRARIGGCSGRPGGIARGGRRGSRPALRGAWQPLRASLDAVAALAGELSPFLPATGEAILQKLGADGGAPPWQQLADGAPIAAPRPLFPRLRAA